MKSLGLLGCAVLCALVGCSASAEEGETSESAVTAPEATPQAACALPYWSWVLHRLQPLLDDPAVSEGELMTAVAAHPPMGETRNTYSACWYPIFAKNFVGNALFDLHNSGIAFVDRTSPDFMSLDGYRRNVKMKPQIARNAKALLALRPSTMTPTDMSIWVNLHSTVLGEAVHPVGMPGPMMYEGVVEKEWIIDAEEAEYLAVVEASRAEPSEDGVYGEWFKGGFRRWTLGPAFAGSRSFVFNVAWEPGAESDNYGLEGVEMVAGTPTIPAPVKSFLVRYGKTAPKAVGPGDSSDFMSMYYARGLRALANLSQNQPMVTKTDALALDVLEAVKPAQLEGAFAYGSWADLMSLAVKEKDASWATRFQKAEPCVAATDLAAAKSVHGEKLGASKIAAPKTCPVD